MISLLKDSRLYDILLQIDKEIAAETRDKGCPNCGGVLHSACYPRKPLDMHLSSSKNNTIRFSLCCSVDNCRRRITPHSVRFLGRKRYLSLTLVLVTAMSQGLVQKRLDELAKIVGVSHRTIIRWKAWWQEIFLGSGFWKYNKSLFVSALNSASLCRDLVEQFTLHCVVTGLINLLRFISPMNGKLYDGVD